MAITRIIADGVANTAITSLGTLSTLTVDNVNINGNSIVATSGALNITPAAGSALVLDGTVNIDAGVITGATSVTSTAFVGALTGNVTGNASGTAATVTTAAQPAITSVGTLTAFRSTGIDDNSNALAMTIDSSENVGIGTASPTALRTKNLEVSSGGTNDGAAFIANKRGTGIASLRLATVGGADGWDINYNHPTSKYLGIYDIENAAYRMIFDTSGNVGIGTTAPQSVLDIGVGSASAPTYKGNIRLLGGALAAHGGLEFQSTTYSSGYGWRIQTPDEGSGSTPIVFQARANTAAWTELLRVTPAGNVGIGTTAPSQKLEVAGNILATGGSISIGTGGLYQAGSIYSDANWGMIFRAKQASPGLAEFRWANSADTERMRILSGGGLTFNGDTAAANALDDYEEGTWTPGITGSTSGSKTMSASNAGFYTKIGNNCTVSGTISASGSETIAGTVYVTGLPFAAHGGANGRASGSVGTNGIFTCPADYRLSFVVDPNNTVMYAIAAKDEATITYNHTPSAGAGNVFGFSLTYRTA